MDNDKAWTISIYKSVDCGDLFGKKDSQYLSGALAANQDFFYMDIIKDKLGQEGILNYSSVESFLPENSDITNDQEHNIFIGSAGAVVDAFDLENIPKSKQDKVIENIIQEKQLQYPEYTFQMLPGKFPLVAKGSLMIDGKYKIHSYAQMSTHILYIKDYEQHLKSPEKNVCQKYKK